MSTDFSPQMPEISPLAEGLVARSFTDTFEAESKPNPASVAFSRAIEQGFYEQWNSDEHVQRELAALAQDQQTATGVYADPGFIGLEQWGEAYEQFGFGPDYPVGTFVDYDKTLNAGGAEPLPVRLITGVTVNPGFRRRGILKHMITARLADAVQEGLPLAALTVSEGSIYGRFGFGAATREQKVEINTTASGRSGLRLRAPETGRVLPVDPSRLEEFQREVFAAHHRSTRGSVERQATYWKIGTAQWDPENITSTWRKARAIVHIKADGSAGGWAIFTFEGWGSKPLTMTVRDMITVDAESRRELLRHLGEMDLVDQLVFNRSFPVDDPLPQALQNPRACRVTGISDVLWVRILNPVTALEGRAWGADGEFSLTLTDPLGIAQGVFTVSVSGGVAQVSSTESATTPQHFTMDVETLGALYLGDISVLTMADAGRITADEDADWTGFSATFDLPTRPFCATHF